MQLHSSNGIKSRNPNNIAGGQGLPADNLWRSPKKRSKFLTKQVVSFDDDTPVKNVTVRNVGWRADGKVVGVAKFGAKDVNVVKVGTQAGIKKSSSVGIWRAVA